MSNEKLIEGQELIELITTTEDALSEINKFAPRDRDKEKMHDDKMFNLAICQYKDGSGICANLARYSGNVALINVIKKELERQLNDFKSQFETL